MHRDSISAFPTPRTAEAAALQTLGCEFLNGEQAIDYHNPKAPPRITWMLATQGEIAGMKLKAGDLSAAYQVEKFDWNEAAAHVETQKAKDAISATAPDLDALMDAMEKLRGMNDAELNSDDGKFNHAFRKDYERIFDAIPADRYLDWILARLNNPVLTRAVGRGIAAYIRGAMHNRAKMIDCIKRREPMVTGKGRDGATYIYNQNNKLARERAGHKPIR